MNPYAAHLGDRNAVEVIENTSRRLYEASAVLGAAGIEWRPAPNKWNAREILCHLADCEIVFAFRLRQTLAEDHHRIQPFDQEKWAGTYGGRDVRLALDVFSSLRDWNVALIRSASPEQLAKKVTHPERGQETFQTIVETMGGHDLNHLTQLEKIMAACAGSSTGIG
jgi:DinB superfamily